MIIFKSIKWKNFLSTGNQFTEINFEKHHTNLIIGCNGSGKSTILDALTFVLFNKPFRKINKSQLVNTTNEKDTLVEISFSINKKNYIVRRGIKPNIFDIIVNGKPLDKQSDDRLTQKILEDNILKFNYKSFTQIVILGSSTFIPFMQLTTAHRREVIDDLLDIKVLSLMNTIIKEKIKKQKEEVRTLEFDRKSFSDKVEMQKEFILKLKNIDKENVEEINKKIFTLSTECDNYSLLNSKLEENIFSYTKDAKDLNYSKDELEKLKINKGELNNQVSSIKKEHKFFNNNTVCPTCSQNLEEEFRLNRIADVQNKAKELHNCYEKLESAIILEQERERQFLALSKEVTKLNNEISQNNARISFNQRQIRDLQYEIQKVTNQFKNRNIENEKLKTYKEKLNTTLKHLAKNKEQLEHYEYAYNLLKDDGVKTKIIKKYLPFINKQVNKYLHMMDFYINFNLDDEFNETIKSPIHEDFSYSSFSEGEKARIDLSLIFTWREIAKIKNSLSTNIILFDEVFDSSLDSFGSDELLKIMKYVVKDANIFVISHKEGLEDKFDNVIKYEKKSGFSYKKETGMKKTV